MAVLVVTSIICGTVFASIISVLVYFSLFHGTRKYETLENRIETLEGSLAKTNDDITYLMNKIGARHR